MSSSSQTSEVRIVFVTGPGDLNAAYKSWERHDADKSSFGGEFLEEFFEESKRLNATCHLISPLPGVTARHPNYYLEHRPYPLPNASGIIYHLVQIYYLLGVALTAIKFKANLLMVTPSRPYWFVLCFLPPFGIKILPSLHCALWPKFQKKPRSVIVQFFFQLTRFFYCHSCIAMLTASEDIAVQIRALTKGKNKPLFGFLPTYKPQDFNHFQIPEHSTSPFRILFVGRVEATKGIYSIIELAHRFSRENHQIEFHICGIGSALEDFSQKVKDNNLESSVIIHGFCYKPVLLQIYQQAHAVIIPTTTEFGEGFNRVVVESILSYRPVITSAVCIPVESHLDDAVIQVPPNDIPAYGNAIAELYKSQEYYNQKVQGCQSVRSQFLNPVNSWGYQFKTILENFF